MLHELFLSLSGHPSSLLSSVLDHSDGSASPEYQILSPPERSLLGSIARLSQLHRTTIDRAAQIAAVHPSAICKAVSAAIASKHLGKFRQKIVDVERKVLRKDAQLVGGFDIVPLSAVVGEFDGWARRMEWYSKITYFMLPSRKSVSPSGPEALRISCSGAALIDRLREESNTGYPDIAETVSDLMKVAETAWLRQLSSWILYGKLPEFGTEDFFIHEVRSEGSLDGEHMLGFHSQKSLIPKFVDPSTAGSILFIGRSLNLIRTRAAQLVSVGGTAQSFSPELSLLPMHLRHISSLVTPISSSSLSSTIGAIRLSLSQTTLQQLLPLPKIIEILELFRSFFLLSRGEFAIALITEAEKYIRSRHRRPGQQPDAQITREGLGSVVLKEGEVTGVLVRTWATLSAIQNGEENSDDGLDLARDLIRLELAKFSDRIATPVSNEHGNNPTMNHSFRGFLLPVDTSLNLTITSPLDLFLTSSNLEIYSMTHAYLLSIRRGHHQLSSMWSYTSLRRDHPSPAGPPFINTPLGHQTVLKRRLREQDRRRWMRPFWATTSAAVFILGELGDYFQRDVVEPAWIYFRAWIEAPSTVAPRPTSTTSSHSNISVSQWNDPTIPGNRRDSTEFASAQQTPHDPETLSRAHHVYLTSLVDTLLLTDSIFTNILYLFLKNIDLYLSLIRRLQSVQHSLDLELDEGVVDSFADFHREEVDLKSQLKDARSDVEDSMQNLVRRLKEVDRDTTGGFGPARATSYTADGDPSAREREFSPPKPPGIDRLLMKLDYERFGHIQMEENITVTQRSPT